MWSLTASIPYMVNGREKHRAAVVSTVRAGRDCTEMQIGQRHSTCEKPKSQRDCMGDCPALLPMRGRVIVAESP